MLVTFGGNKESDSLASYKQAAMGLLSANFQVTNGTISAEEKQSLRQRFAQGFDIIKGCYNDPTLNLFKQNWQQLYRDLDENHLFEKNSD